MKFAIAMARVALAVQCTLAAAPVSAEAPVSDLQTWAQLQTTLDLAPVLPRWSANLESTLRRGSPALVDAQTGAQTEAPLTYLFVRPSIGYDLRSWLNATLGYAWAPVYYDDAALRSSHEVHEHRVWEQLSASQGLGAISLASRTRVEERMRTHGPGDGQTAVRVRQRFRLAYTLKHGEPWQLVSTDELMFFLNDTDFESHVGFSENRAFFGVGYRVDDVVVELGYLNQYVGGKTRVRRENHVLSTSVSFRFDLALDAAEREESPGANGTMGTARR